MIKYIIIDPGIYSRKEQDKEGDNWKKAIKNFIITLSQKDNCVFVYDKDKKILDIGQNNYEGNTFITEIEKQNHKINIPISYDGKFSSFLSKIKKKKEELPPIDAVITTDEFVDQYKREFKGTLKTSIISYQSTVDKRSNVLMDKLDVTEVKPTEENIDEILNRLFWCTSKLVVINNMKMKELLGFTKGTEGKRFTVKPKYIIKQRKMTFIFQAVIMLNKLLNHLKATKSNFNKTKIIIYTQVPSDPLYKSMYLNNDDSTDQENLKKENIKKGKELLKDVLTNPIKIFEEIKKINSKEFDENYIKEYERVIRFIDKALEDVEFYQTINKMINEKEIIFEINVQKGKNESNHNFMHKRILKTDNATVDIDYGYIWLPNKKVKENVFALVGSEIKKNINKFIDPEENILKESSF